MDRRLPAVRTAPSALRRPTVVAATAFPISVAGRLPPADRMASRAFPGENAARAYARQASAAAVDRATADARVTPSVARTDVTVASAVHQTTPRPATALAGPASAHPAAARRPTAERTP